MKAHWWSCVLGLLCLPTEVTLNIWTVSQNPSSISVIRVNSSAEIKCTTTLPEPMGLSVRRRFHGTGEVVYLSLKNGEITKNTTAAEFKGRIQITQEEQTAEGHGFTLWLSWMGLEDTDLYYCSWTYFRSQTLEKVPSRGTVIIVREKDPMEHCNFHFLDLVLITLSGIAFAGMLFLITGALIVKCSRFKKKFRPVRAVKTSRPNRHERVCPHQRAQHCPYLVTSENTLDFQGIPYC